MIVLVACAGSHRPTSGRRSAGRVAGGVGIGRMLQSVIVSIRPAMVVRVVRQLLVDPDVRDGPGWLSEERQQQDDGHSGAARGDHDA